MTRDMTRGRCLPLILGFCLPMVCGNILQQFYNLADTAIVGRCINPNALAAIGVTGSVCFLVLGFATGLCTGLSIPVAQMYGAGRMEEMRRYMSNAAYIAGAVTVVLTIVTVAGCRTILRLMQTPEEILDDATRYLTVIFAGIAATVLYNLLAAFLRAMGDSRTPLLFLAMSSVLNIVLDYVMIRYMGLGVMGAGLATVISQGVSALCCLYYMYRHFDVLTFQKEELRVQAAHCARLCGVSLPMAFQFSITAIGSIILQSSVNDFGPTVIASVTAAIKIQCLVASPLESLGITMATFCGQNLGAVRMDRIREGLRSSLVTSVIYATLAYAAVFFLGQYFVYLFVDTKEEQFADIMRYTVQYLHISGLFYPVLGILFVLRNSLQGLGYGVLPMSAGILELVARVFAALCMVTAMGYTGVCLASPVAWLAADALLISACVYAMYSLPKRIGVPETA